MRFLVGVSIEIVCLFCREFSKNACPIARVAAFHRMSLLVTCFRPNLALCTLVLQPCDSQYVRLSESLMLMLRSASEPHSTSVMLHPCASICLATVTIAIILLEET
jgi:hypothetical protein